MSSLEEIFIEHLKAEGLDAKAIILIVADMFPVFKVVAGSWLKQKQTYYIDTNDDFGVYQSGRIDALQELLKELREDSKKELEK